MCLSSIRDLSSDVAMASMIDRAIAGNPGWLRDSAGLWLRFQCMLAEGELTLQQVDADRLARAVAVLLQDYEANGGNSPEHGGALYAQAAMSLLCARASGSATAYLVPLVRRVGFTTVSKWKGKAAKVRNHLPKQYAEAVTDEVWGGKANDVVLKTFF